MTDAEGSGARSRLDAVLQGLVEKSDSERLVFLFYLERCSTLTGLTLKRTASGTFPFPLIKLR